MSEWESKPEFGSQAADLLKEALTLVDNAKEVFVGKAQEALKADVEKLQNLLEKTRIDGSPFHSSDAEESGNLEGLLGVGRLNRRIGVAR